MRYVRRAVAATATILFFFISAIPPANATAYGVQTWGSFCVKGNCFPSGILEPRSTEKGSTSAASGRRGRRSGSATGASTSATTRPRERCTGPTRAAPTTPARVWRTGAFPRAPCPTTARRAHPSGRTARVWHRSATASRSKGSPAAGDGCRAECRRGSRDARSDPPAL